MYNELQSMTCVKPVLSAYTQMLKAWVNKCHFIHSCVTFSEAHGGIQIW